MKGCLIIHGYTGGPYEVDPLAQYLKKNTNWHVRTPVLPGHGEELALEDVTYEAWIEKGEHALQEMLDMCEEVYVIGFSMGGMIAAYLAAHYDVDRLVLLATARKYICFKHMSRYIGKLIGEGFRGNLDDNKLYTHYKSKMKMVPFRANIEFMRLVNETKQYLSDVHSPVLIAQGKKDMIVPTRSAYYLDKEIASEHKEVILFEQSKHLICLGNDKKILNKKILTFLTQSIQVDEDEMVSTVSN